MRVNIYAEEMTERIEIIEKTTPDGTFTGLRFYLELPVTVGGTGSARVAGQRNPPNVYPDPGGEPSQVAGPFMHHSGDDDSAAVTFWGKQDLRRMLQVALTKLDAHYADDPSMRTMGDLRSALAAYRKVL